MPRMRRSISQQSRTTPPPSSARRARSTWAFCRHAMTDMLDLLKNDPKLRVVLKEFPVLGEGSVQAAQVAVAVRMQDKTGKKYIDFHTKLLSGRGPADKARALAVAKEVGLDMARIDKD